MENILSRIKDFSKKIELFYVATSNQKKEVHLAVAKGLTFYQTMNMWLSSRGFAKKL